VCRTPPEERPKPALTVCATWVLLSIVAMSVLLKRSLIKHYELSTAT